MCRWCLLQSGNSVAHSKSFRSPAGARNSLLLPEIPGA
jgi:hypothetical protein